MSCRCNLTFGSNLKPILNMLASKLVPKLAFDLLKEAEATYSGQQKLPNEILTELYSLFGNVLFLATELLENCKIIQYQTPDKSRKIYKIGNNDRYTIYDNINFCHCQTFLNQVLEDKTSLTCKHVLAVKLNQITGTVKVRYETVTESQLVEFLNEQLITVNEI